MEWLNSNSSAIQAISTVAIALLTLFYVNYTKKLLSNAKQETLNQKIPVIVFRFREIPDQLNQHIVRDIQERLVNIGSGPALDIELRTNGKFRDFEIDMKDKDSDGLMPWLKYPIDNVLGSDSGDPDMQICFIVSKGAISILKNPSLVLKVTYKDIFGRRYETLFKNCKNEFHQVSINQTVPMLASLFPKWCSGCGQAKKEK